MDWDDFRHLTVRARTVLGLSEADLAERVGWIPAVVTAFEAGECAPSPDVTVELWRVLVEAHASMN